MEMSEPEIFFEFILDRDLFSEIMDCQIDSDDTSGYDNFRCEIACMVHD